MSKIENKFSINPGLSDEENFLLYTVLYSYNHSRDIEICKKYLQNNYVDIMTSYTIEIRKTAVADPIDEFLKIALNYLDKIEKMILGLKDPKNEKVLMNNGKKTFSSAEFSQEMKERTEVGKKFVHSFIESQIRIEKIDTKSSANPTYKDKEYFTEIPPTNIKDFMKSPSFGNTEKEKKDED